MQMHEAPGTTNSSGPPLPAGATLWAGPLELRLDDRLAVVAGRPLILSVREHDLLVALARRANRVVSREEIYSAVWGGTMRRGDRSVDVYVRRLRAKLADASPAWHYIHTHIGFGYRLAPTPSHEFHTRATGR